MKARLEKGGRVRWEQRKDGDGDGEEEDQRCRRGVGEKVRERGDERSDFSLGESS